MSTDGCTLVVGGTAGIGQALARHYAGTGRETVLTGRGLHRAQEVAAKIGGSARGIALDLAEPKTIRDSLSSVGPVRYLAIVAIERDDNTIREFDIDRALRLVTLKLVGFAEVVHVLLDRLAPDSSIVLFGPVSRATARSGTASRRRSSRATCRRRSPSAWPRWTTSSTARASCSRTRPSTGSTWWSTTAA